MAIVEDDEPLARQVASEDIYITYTGTDNM
jgi:hypothetical protein